MKEFSQIVHGKGLFVSIKGHLCLTKDHLANPEGQVEIEFLHWKLFLTLLNQIKKKIKIKRALFNQASDPRMLYPSRIGSDHQDLPWLHEILLIYTIRNHLDCLFYVYFGIKFLKLDRLDIWYVPSAANKSLMFILRVKNLKHIPF